MVAAGLQQAVAHLQKQVEIRTDDELLRRFSHHRDEAAFAELVRRHGPMVLGVGRRAIGNHHTAEDVLQATFLLLARKAQSIRWHGTVGPWLYAVAVRCARKAIEDQRRFPRALALATAPDSLPGQALAPDQPALWQEVRTVLDEELAQLPESLREPMVLCYLQGRTRDEAALQLGLTVATLKRRLVKGRERLRCRLSRRGLNLTAALGAILASDAACSAETVRAVVQAALSAPISGPFAVWLGIGRWLKLLAVAATVTVAAAGVWFATIKPESTEQPAEPPMVPGKPPAIPAGPPMSDRTDILGDPLPAGAVARLGTTRLRPGKMIEGMAYSPDGKQLAIWSRQWGGDGTGRLIFADSTTGRETKAIALPTNQLLALRWLADGRGLALAKIDQNDFFLWHFTDPDSSIPVKDRQNISFHKNGDVLTAAISPDGKWLATGRWDVIGTGQPIELWETRPNVRLADLKPRMLGRQNGHCRILLFSKDGKQLFALCQMQARLQAGPGPIQENWADKARLVVYDVPSGTQRNAFDVVPPLIDLFGAKLSPECMSLSPDGKTLLIGDERGAVHTYDWASGKETNLVIVHPAGDLAKFERAGISAMALSPDGKTLFTSNRSNLFTIRDKETNQVCMSIRDQSFRNGFVFTLSPDGTHLAVADAGISGRIRLLDPKTGADRLPLSGHTGRMTDLLVLPNGTAITAASDQQMRWWNVETGGELKHQPFETLIHMRKWSSITADGNGAFGVQDQQLRYTDLPTGKQTTILDRLAEPWKTIHGVSGSMIFFSTPDVKMQQWDAKSGKIQRSFEALGSDVGRVIISPDERHVAMISAVTTTVGNSSYFNGSQINLFDAKTGKLHRRWRTVDANLECAEFSADGKYLVLGGYSLSMKNSVAPGESLLPIPARSGLVLFDAVTGEPIRSYEPLAKSGTDSAHITTLAISPNGHLIAAAQFDHSIAVYELATGGLCRMFRGHQEEINQLAFTADGRRLVSVSADMTGLVWDLSYASLAKSSAAVADMLWADLAKPEWELAGSALAALAAQPNEFLTLVRKNLQPATGPDFDPTALKKLAAQLGDPIFAVRERATNELLRHGREVLPPLREELAQANAEKRRRLQSICDQIARSPVPSERLREVRVLALLDQQKSAGARTELKRLAAGHSEASRTREAKTILAR